MTLTMSEPAEMYDSESLSSRPRAKKKKKKKKKRNWPLRVAQTGGLGWPATPFIYYFNFDFLKI
jgi:hypothetical protein